MTNRSYFSPAGGMPGQSQTIAERAVFSDAYVYIPKGVMCDIVTSNLPFWDKTRLWVLARPLSGFAETFSQYLMEVEPGGGSERPEDDANAQAVLFVVEGELEVTLEGKKYIMAPGGYGYIPPGSNWHVRNASNNRVCFHWIRKAYDFVEGIKAPEAFFTNERDVTPTDMPDTKGVWSTTRFVDPADVRHDMHVNIVNFKPGGLIPFEETHVMEHGIYVLEGRAKYLLNKDWINVEAGDFLWLRAFCPQACIAEGPDDFRYLLYKDVNRQMKLKL